MNEHSKNFEKIKNYYDKGLWSIEKVRSVVGKKLGITEEEFEEITGQPFNPEVEEIEEETIEVEAEPVEKSQEIVYEMAEPIVIPAEDSSKNEEESE